MCCSPAQLFDLSECSWFHFVNRSHLPFDALAFWSTINHLALFDNNDSLHPDRYLRIPDGKGVICITSFLTPELTPRAFSLSVFIYYVILASSSLLSLFIRPDIIRHSRPLIYFPLRTRYHPITIPLPSNHVPITYQSRTFAEGYPKHTLRIPQG